MTEILLIGFILGVFFGAWIVSRFDVPNTEINGKYKAKNGANMNLTNEVEPIKNRKSWKLFKNIGRKS